MDAPASIMASATPAASVRGTSPSAPEARGVRGLRHHAQYSNVANTVSVAKHGSEFDAFFSLLTFDHIRTIQL